MKLSNSDNVMDNPYAEQAAMIYSFIDLEKKNSNSSIGELSKMIFLSFSFNKF